MADDVKIGASNHVAESGSVGAAFLSDQHQGSQVDAAPSSFAPPEPKPFDTPDAGCDEKTGSVVTLTSQRYDVLYADPPWDYRGGSQGISKTFHARASHPGSGSATRKASADRHYPCMPLADLIGMRPVIDAFASEPCALFLWATWPKLPEAIDLIDGWGFAFVTCAFVWVKTTGQQSPLWVNPEKGTRCGMGFYFRGNTEFVLFARRGKPRIPKDRTIRQLVFEPLREHSRKPDEVRRRIERAYPAAKRLEMFARETAPGWDAWGNEVGKFDEQ